MSLMERMKKAGRLVVDTGAKTMLKTDIMLLEREIKTRKQNFGIEVYDSMVSDFSLLRGNGFSLVSWTLLFHVNSLGITSSGQ